MSMTLVDCGCVARVYPDDSGIELIYCSMHEAAPDLLEACEAGFRELIRIRNTILMIPMNDGVLDKMDAAIQKTKGDT